MCYMKNTTLTIRLDSELEALLSEVCKKKGTTRSEWARRALWKELKLQQFESLRKRIVPYAEEQGYFTDDDVFNEIS